MASAIFIFSTQLIIPQLFNDYIQQWFHSAPSALCYSSLLKLEWNIMENSDFLVQLTIFTSLHWELMHYMNCFCICRLKVSMLISSHLHPLHPTSENRTSGIWWSRKLSLKALQHFLWIWQLFCYCRLNWATVLEHQTRIYFTVKYHGPFSLLSKPNLTSNNEAWARLTNIWFNGGKDSFMMTIGN